MRFHIIPSFCIVALGASTLHVGCNANVEPETQRTENATNMPAHLTDDAAPPPAPAAPSQSTLAQAREILAEASRVYREAPTLTDSIQLTFQGETQVMNVRFDINDERTAMSLPTASAVSIDGKMYMTTEVMYDLYYEKELDGKSAGEVIADIGWVPPFQYAMRQTENVDAYLPGLGLGVLRNPRLRGYTEITEDDRAYHVISFDAPSGSGRAYIDAESMLITRIRMDLLPGPNQPAASPRIPVHVETNPTIADELAEPIAFEPGDRMAVHDANELTPRALGVGDRAPDFTLKTFDGETVRLSDLRGQVVVLDFWATWCVPCILAMPHFDRFARWAAEENQAVRVFAINTMEQAATPEERRQLAEGFWNEQDFTVPVLLDDENRVVLRYGYTSIPMTIVIGPDGTITRTHDHFSRNMYQILKTAAERALENAAVNEDE